MQHHTSIKAMVRDFYRRAVGQGDIAFAEQILAEDYIQHSPMAKPGKAGILEALAYLKQMPKPANPSKPFMRLIAEGDYVVVNLSFSWEGKQKAVVDIFRVQDGKLAEHWDAIQDQPEVTLNGNSMLEGPVEIEDVALTGANKKVVEEFYQHIFVKQELEALSEYISDDLIQHHPDIENGKMGLKNYFIQKSGKFSIKKVHRMIGEGNFVVVQSEGQINDKPYVFYDIFRLTDSKVVEQWSINQPIPAVMPHNNGMI